ncbi:aminoacyl-tRNA hydrolase [Dasania sp. GY-MA-18]|uniref:Peptidyl-tRNA hydrolase n=1 Tax=Dasania phycosphaerae TaxID=2950436 RepID=A0A9J6RIX3_9GAMM|nr:MULTISPECIES: aminoacyl-tRNA hydrolase [Dasania]MCR8921497.1 aminoacyl-tRNA hydrolase [Dasania sp. GY-MA-18]MCZ0863925.1 aminoacyl-tRNA hydrolase [Dasania phycosphaerae]MCZ0867653.1 aminoacyl-tRNA hydrolase [Dasania phycosphaerae]
MSAIELIVGLGNPGREYEETRHNAGALFVSELARQYNATLKSEAKFFGDTARINLVDSLGKSHDVRLLIPSTFMNRSGLAIAAMASFYKVAPEKILVAHDELDIDAGTARFKQGCGHGGHNGLRDTIAKLGNNKNFHRLRIGIGHPGSADKVTGYVLNKAPAKEHQMMMDIIDDSIRALPHALAGDWAKAMHHLHSIKA